MKIYITNVFFGISQGKWHNVSSDRSMKTPLHYICQHSPPYDIVKLLLQKIAASPLSVWSIDFNGNTCLHSFLGGSASASGFNSPDLDLLRLLIHVSGVQKLTGEFSLEQSIEYLSYKNERGCTPLHFLVSRSIYQPSSQCEFLKEVLTLSEDIGYIVDNDGESLLHYCAYEGNDFPIEIFRTLVHYCPKLVSMRCEDYLRPCDVLWKVPTNLCIYFNLTFIIHKLLF